MIGFFKYFHKFVEPALSITNIEERRKARFFSGLMLMLLSITGIYILIAQILNFATENNKSDMIANLTALVLMLSIYIISRSKYHKFTAIIFIIVISFFFYMTIAVGESESLVSNIFYFIIPVLVAGVMFSIRGLSIITIGSIIGMFLYAAYGPNMEASYALTFVINSSMIMIIAATFLAYSIRINQEQQQQLHKNELRFRALSEAASEAIFFFEDNFLLEQNYAAEQLFGYTLNEAKGKALTDWIVPEYREQMRNYVEHGYETPCEISALRKDGSTFVMEIRGKQMPYEDRMIQVISCQDITQRKQTEKALRESEERIQITLDNISEGCQIIDFDWRYIYVNDMAVRHGRIPKEEKLGYTVFDVHPNFENSKRYSAIKDCLEHRTAHQSELSYVESDGTQFWFNLSVQPVPDGAFLLSVDITEHKQAERQELELHLERERTQLITSFITKASHEFKTPLSVIGNSLYLQEKVTDALSQQKYRDSIKVQTKAILRLVESLTLMVRLENITQLNFHPIKLNQILSMIVASSQTDNESNQIIFQLNLDESVPTIQGDEDKLSLALTYLIENAIRYTPNKGEITIQASLQDDNLMISIKDNGIGMTSDEQDRIFELFYRVDKAHTTRGMGLGLPIAQKIVKLHQGKIEVESTVGKGTTFRVYLPVDAHQE